jgi:hypothetical protein
MHEKDLEAYFKSCLILRGNPVSGSDFDRICDLIFNERNPLVLCK